MLRSRKNIQDFLYVGLAQVTSVVAGLVGLKLLTNIFEIEQYGTYQLGWSIALIIGTVLFNPIGLSILRLYSIHDANQTREIFFKENATLFFRICLALLSSGVLISYALSYLTSLDIVLSLATVLLVITHGLSMMLQHYLTAQTNHIQFVFSQFLVSFARPFGAAICILLFFAKDEKATAALLGSGIALALVVIIQFWFITVNDSKRSLENSNPTAAPDTTYTDQPPTQSQTPPTLFSIAKPLTYMGIFSALSLYTDRWLMIDQISAAEIATYIAIYTIATAPLNFSYGVVVRFFLPLIYAQKERFGIQLAQNSASVYIAIWALLLGLLFGLTVLSHEFIVRLLTNSEIAKRSELLPLLIVGLGLERTAQVMNVRGNLDLDFYQYIPTRLIHFGLLLITGIILTWNYDIYGFALAHIIAGCGLVASTLYVNSSNN